MSWPCASRSFNEAILFAAPAPASPPPCPSLLGVAAICALQNAAIIGLIFRLGSVQRRTQLLVSAGLLASAWWLFGGACQPHMLTALQTGSVVLLAVGGRLPQVSQQARTTAWRWAGSRPRPHVPASVLVSPTLLLYASELDPCPTSFSPGPSSFPTPPQILLNVRRGNSGELSLLTCALSLAGNLARVFTTATLVKDPIILASAATQVCALCVSCGETWPHGRSMGQQRLHCTYAGTGKAACNRSVRLTSGPGTPARRRC